ncbi:MAG TPA: NHL repeat-containing protein [Acidobacteriota bacterium]|nr:NHL repeat-containing protein [Acidobacteriota bacterium]
MIWNATRLLFMLIALIAIQAEASLNAPVDFALDSEGRIYVVDQTSRGGIFRFDDFSGKTFTEIGIECSPSSPARNNEECELIDPHAISIDPLDRIYVADATGRIVVMDAKTRQWTSRRVESGTPVNLFIDQNGNLLATLDNGGIQMPQSCSGLQRLIEPAGISVDTHRNIYVAESANHQIIRIDPHCNIQKLGTEGQGVKQFIKPTGVAVDKEGHIYIADSGNHRIVRMDDLSGNGWLTYGSFGGTTGGLNSPKTIRIDAQDRIYIGDSGNGRILRINDMSGTGRTELKLRRRPGQFSSPVDVAVDKQNRIYVADKADACVVRIGSKKQSDWIAWDKQGEITLGEPANIFTSNGSIIVSDPKKSQIVMLDSELKTARFISTVKFFIQPFGVFINRDRLFLTDLYKNAIASLDWKDPDKRQIFWGIDVRKLMRPTAICTDSRGRIFVADQVNHRIVRMDNLVGKNWSTLTFPQSGKSKVVPMDISMDRAGALYISDAANDRVIRLGDFSLKKWKEFGKSGEGVNRFQRPSGIFVDSKDRIYIADTGNRRLVRVDDVSGKGWITIGESTAKQISFFPEN